MARLKREQQEEGQHEKKIEVRGKKMVNLPGKSRTKRYVVFAQWGKDKGGVVRKQIEKSKI